MSSMLYQPIVHSVDAAMLYRHNAALYLRKISRIWSPVWPPDPRLGRGDAGLALRPDGHGLSPPVPAALSTSPMFTAIESG
ncbi:hypothetical protein MGAST_20535 [Mycobacterium gastri 'Wayne']|nr:hypothetical protein MGAST_20535 [Mycobacterium gastri 'Wayne']